MADHPAPTPSTIGTPGSTHQLAARDLELLDGAMATMAGEMGLPVEALDTEAWAA